MLVLSRKLGETLVIGGNITVKVIQVQGGAVRLGIEAPKDVPVHRAEIHQRRLAGIIRYLELAVGRGRDDAEPGRGVASV